MLSPFHFFDSSRSRQPPTALARHLKAYLRRRTRSSRKCWGEKRGKSKQLLRPFFSLSNTSSRTHKNLHGNNYIQTGARMVISNISTRQCCTCSVCCSCYYCSTAAIEYPRRALRRLRQGKNVKKLPRTLRVGQRLAL